MNHLIKTNKLINKKENKILPIIKNVKSYDKDDNLDEDDILVVVEQRVMMVDLMEVVVRPRAPVDRTVKHITIF